MSTPLLTPAHHTNLTPVLPEAYRLTDLCELQRAARFYVLNKFMTSASGRCPRARILAELCAKLAPSGAMTNEARQFLMADAEKRAFYRRLLRYLGFRPGAWTHPGAFSPNSSDEPVSYAGIEHLTDLILERDQAQRSAFDDPAHTGHKDRIADINARLAARGLDPTSPLS